VSVRVGVTLMATEPPDRFRELVRLIDAAGFDELWICDSSLHARDVYAYLALVATTSQRLAFGPNCTHPYTRHPAITVNAIATLQELSGGRARLALGVGDRPVTELGYRAAPVAMVREAITVARALTSGGEVTREGPITLARGRLTMTLPWPLPIYVAASGAKMLELGGEVADGVLFFSGVHAPCIEWALARVADGARRAGRDPASVDVACTVAGSLREDVATARRECVPMAAWFPQTAPACAALAGVPADVSARIRAAYAGGHFDGAHGAFAHVTDEMVDRFTSAGGADLWRRRLKDVIALGVRHINVFVLSRDPRDMLQAFARDVLPAVRGLA
jgi:5,10-methylenetetrahydromethanopterin reductase